jgi:hypothetical protein
MYSNRYSCEILMKIKFFQQILEKFSYIKFHENPFRGSRAVSYGRKDGQA